MQELHELSVSFDNTSPLSMTIPSPSPSPSPHPWTRHHHHSPNIYITSPTSPTPFGSSHPSSPSRDSQTHSNPNSHPTLPTLAIPNPVTAGSSPPFHSPLSSPTTSDIVPSYVSQRSGHGRSLSHLGTRIARQPNITFTLDSDDDGRVEKRARTEGDKVKDGLEGLRVGEEMDVVPSDVEDVKLSATMSLTSGSPTTNPGVGVGTGVGGNKMGHRSRSDSAPMWSADGTSVQSGLSANWMGRGRSGNSFGQ